MEDWTGKPYLALLADKEEDRFTEFLGHLLRSKELLKYFIHNICELTSIQDFDELRIQTQLIVEEGRPDLVISNDSTYLVFESKVGSAPETTQLKRYMAHIQKWNETHAEGITKLFLIAPLANIDFFIEEANKQIIANLVGHYEELVGISWEMIAKSFYGFKDNISNNTLKVHLEEFYELVNYRLGTLDRPFTQEEINIYEDNLTAQAILRGRELVEKIRLKLIPEFRIQNNGGFSAAKSLSYGIGFEGYYFTYENRKWWFGVWIDVWAEIGVSPVVLQLLGKRKENSMSLSSNFPRPMFSRRGNGYFIPYKITAGEELDSIAKTITCQITEYCKKNVNTGEPA